MDGKMMETVAQRAWWMEAVVYQIYPRSFNDSNGDGIGDIPGITEKVEYLDALGVDCVWLCPVYDSPNEDNGYDIRDYRAIGEEFGTMADWERLLEELHARDIRLIMDLVVNHTSDEHEWFRKSRREVEGYEEYYHWVEGSPEEPPNNWKSIFGGSAWSWDDERGAWYLHVFDEKQPDLNWRNPAVRESVKDVMRFWLEKGIDGFRMDAINHIVKREGYPDGEPGSVVVGAEHFKHVPPIREYLAELERDVLAEYDVLIAGEMGGTSIEEAAAYLDRDDTPLDMVFQFNHLDVDQEPNEWTPGEGNDWDLRELKTVLTRCQNKLSESAWDAVFMGNHDVPRQVSRFGDDEYRTESATLIGTLLLTLRGTPYLYQGDELGVTNAEFTDLDELDDPMTLGLVEDLLAAGRIDSEDEALEFVNSRSRDHARMPMPWSATENAGFTDGEPWLGVGEDHTDVNVEAARDDADSVWHHYRRLIELRDDDALVYGGYDLLCPEHERIYAYTRRLGDERRLVVLNWSAERAEFDPGAVGTADAELLLSNYAVTPSDPTGHTFRPYEACVYRL
jgi:oligo-1,6-glucosidase